MEGIKYTPNYYRNVKKQLRIVKAEYEAIRKAYLKDQKTLSIIGREERLGELLRVRWDFRQCLNRVHVIEDAGVELGAAWSPRALARRQGR